MFSEMPASGAGQVKAPRVVVYANSILNQMYDYLIEKILEHNLHFEYRDRLRSDPGSFKLNGSSHGGADGLDPRTYYLFKYVYGGDRRYALEHTEHWADFNETLFITQATVI